MSTGIVIVAMAASALVGAPAAGAKAKASGSDSGPAAHHDTSPPLRDVHPTSEGAHKEKKEKHDKRDEGLPHPLVTSATDPVVQSTQSAAVPATASSFDGVGQGFTGPAGTFTVNSAPPDTNAAVGATQIFELVNTSFAIFDKSGTAVYGPAATNTLWSGFGGSCQTTNDGDATVRWDTLASRWIVTQFANVGSGKGPYFECVAVSQSADATGVYYRYAFQYANFPDYPKLGVWPDAYYITFNLFSAGGSAFLGAEACAYDRASMLAGAAATQQCGTTSVAYGGLLPSDLDGATAPPAGRPNLLVAIGSTTTSLAYWQFHVDWATPANTTFTGPISLPVAGYAEACGGGTCIPQPATTNQLDSLADRLMYRLAYRNLGSSESLVVSHSVDVGSSTGARWYELRLASDGTPTVYQQSTYAPDTTDRWMPSAAMDKLGDIALGFSASSGTVRPSVAYSGRLAGDATGSMTQGEATVLTGGGSQTGTLHRWGDYASMAVDPVDDCTFWFATEYIPANGSFNWRTRLASFRLGTCGSTTGEADFSTSVSPPSASITAGSTANVTASTQSTTSGNAQTVTMTASGLPAGASASFNPSSVTVGGSSTMTISTASSTPQGTYPITITGTGSSATHSASFTLTVNPSSTAGIANGNFESGSLSPWTVSGAATVTTSAHTGSYAAQVGSTSATNGDSSISQTFVVPGGNTSLSFWYAVTCPDTVTYDWATATLKDNTTGSTSTPLARTCANTGTWKKVSAAVTAGHSYTLTLTSHDDNYVSDATYTRFDDIVLSAPPPGITNGGFETGTFKGWTTSGAKKSVVTSPHHSGTYAALLGASTATKGDSSIAQTFTVPAGKTTLSFWYLVSCPDTVTYDWGTATLGDASAGTTSTPLARTCTNNGTWQQVSVAVSAGHSYTLTLTNHDNNNSADPTSTAFDDVTFS